jgi:hypothetical protein
MKPYFSTVQHAAEIAPDLANPTKFIRWADDISQVIAFAYDRDYDEVTTDLVEKVKEVQDFEDED